MIAGNPQSPSVLVFVIAGLFVIALVLLWIVLVRRPGRAHARCAECHADVGATVGVQCAVCGRDLRDVGIDPPRLTTLGPLAFAVLWTALLIFPGFVMFTTFISRGPASRSISVSVQILSLPAQTDGYDVRYEVQVPRSAPIAGGSIGRDDTPDPSVWRLTLPAMLHAGVEPRVVLTATTRAGAAVPLELSGAAAIGAGDGIPAWVRKVSVREDRTAVDRSAETLRALMTAIIDGDTVFTTDDAKFAGLNMSVGSMHTPLWFVFVAGACPVAVWAVGLAAFARLRMRRSIA